MHEIFSETPLASIVEDLLEKSIADNNTESYNYLNEAYENYTNYAADRDGVLDLSDLKDESNSYLLDTLHNYAGYTWMLIYAAEYALRYENKWNKSDILKEIKAIEEFQNLAMKFTLFDTKVSSVIQPDLYNLVWEYRRLENYRYKELRLAEARILSPLAVLSGKYIQFYNFLKDKIDELEGKITTEQLAYKTYYEQQGGYREWFISGKTKSLTEIAEEHGKRGFKSLEGFYNKVSDKKYRTNGDENNLKNLQFVLAKLHGKPESITKIKEDQKLAELNSLKIETAK